MKNAHEFKGLYDDLDVDLKELGCLMIDTECPVIAPESLKDLEYVSPDPKKFWVKGVLKDWHVTVRYGLMPNVRARHIDKVLEEYPLPKSLEVDKIEIFPSPYEDERYDCYVALVNDKKLHEMNQQLSVLPNLNTFPVYKPHITIGYFKRGWNNVLKGILEEILLYSVETIGYNYGHILSKEEDSADTDRNV